MKDNITGVPPDQVGQVVQDFVDDGAMNVAATLDDDGTFTVAAS
jgi:hypothetical protein